MDSLRKLRSKHVLGIFFFFICFFLVASDYGICSQTGQFSNRESNFGLLGIGLLTTSLFFAHASAPNDYSLKRNTISELAGQNYKYAWIMRSGFIGFGLFTAAAALDGAINSTIHPIKSASLGLYGASMVLSGIYSAPSFHENMPYSVRDARAHSVSANIAGLALTSAMIASFLTEPDQNRRVVHAAATVCTLATSVLFKWNPDSRGVWQRFIWSIGIGWLALGYSF